MPKAGNRAFLFIFAQKFKVPHVVADWTTENIMIISQSEKGFFPLGKEVIAIWDLSNEDKSTHC